MAAEFKRGAVEGTGSAINVSIGFQPDYVKCFNIDDAGDLHAVAEWTTDMADASMFKGLKIADDGTTSNLSNTYVASDGITPYAGDDTNGEGFTIGADGDLNASGETIVWIAMRDAGG
ncbi:MAG: hypothetical protein AAFW97_14570 [Pseudomonadota bacterium]